MRYQISLITIILLTGCASLPDAPTEVKIPVAVPCINAADVPARPAFVTDKELSAMTDADLIIALRTDQLAYRGYVPLLDALVTGCVK